MQTWQGKAVRDGLKSFIPLQETLRTVVRRLRPYRTDPRNDGSLVVDALNQVRLLQSLGVAISGADVVELGTGWKPFLPLLYSRCGAARVTTVDQERLMDAATFRHGLGLLARYRAELADLEGCTPWWDDDGRAQSLAELTAAHRIDYRAPADIRDLPTASADLLVSRDVLEHIPEHLLEDMARHWRRVLRPGGRMCHTIDLSDHWEHLDKSISRVNFLQYAGGWWNLTGLNAQNFQNRLRRFEYVRMFQASGFEVQVSTGYADRKAAAALGGLRLCPRYRGVAPGELAVLSTTIVAVRSSL
jgi:SAM-dependent methyltransferase